MEPLVTLANVLNVAGYFVKDRLWLRLLSFAATCCLVRYFSMRPEPLVDVICWNLFYATLNAILLWRLAVDRFGAAAADGN